MIIGSSILSPEFVRRSRRIAAMTESVVEWTTPVTTETGVFAFVLDWDIVENTVSEMIEGFFRHKVEVDFMKRSTSPEIRFQEWGEKMVNR
jgi:hypothetical protein